ncbi:type III-B CRISPR module-associated protein Cmr5 [Pyxidicoccus sp. 3LG]
MNGQTREQQRAFHAYARVEAVSKDLRAEYKPRVNGLGATVLRDGLAAALTFLERERERGNAADQVLEDLAWCLAQARLPELGERPRGEDLPKWARGLKLDDYMLATRETVRLLVWFRRAVQATFVDGRGGANAQ